MREQHTQPIRNRVNIYKLVVESLIERSRWETQSTALKKIMSSNTFPPYIINPNEIVQFLLAHILK
jgi:hypothetical protein